MHVTERLTMFSPFLKKKFTVSPKLEGGFWVLRKCLSTNSFVCSSDFSLGRSLDRAPRWSSTVLALGSSWIDSTCTLWSISPLANFWAFPHTVCFTSSVPPLGIPFYRLEHGNGQNRALGLNFVQYYSLVFGRHLWIPLSWINFSYMIHIVGSPSLRLVTSNQWLSESPSSLILFDGKTQPEH